MGRRRDSDYSYIEPRTVKVTVDGVTHEGTLHISPSGPNRYQYSVSYGDDYRTNTEDLMPSTYLCEVYGKMDLVSMVKAKQEK
jgi:hypothetical protein